MIRLTRFNRQPFVVNSDAIKFVESAPDTTITLLNGERFLVLETVEEVIERIIAFRRDIWPAAAISGASLQAAAPAAGAGEASRAAGWVRCPPSRPGGDPQERPELGG